MHDYDDEKLEKLSFIEKVIAAGKYHLTRDYSGEQLTFKTFARASLKALAGKKVILGRFTLEDALFVVLYGALEDMGLVAIILGCSVSHLEQREKLIRAALGIKERSERKDKKK